jgi:hypothetical protein
VLDFVKNKTVLVFPQTRVRATARDNIFINIAFYAAHTNPTCAAISAALFSGMAALPWAYSPQ